MPTYEYSVSETALLSALETARSAGKNLAVVFDRNEAGEIIRIGCALVTRENPDPEPPITWFESHEITRVLQADSVDHALALLDVEFRPQTANESYRLVYLPATHGRARLRSLIRVHRNRSIGFAIQVEIQQERAMWEAVVRYDSAHGSLHRDLMSRGGQKVKTQLPAADACTAIDYAFHEIRANIVRWLGELGYGVMCTLDAGQELDRALNQARDELLDLWRDPSGIQDAASHYTEVKLSPDFEERIEVERDASP